MAKLKGLASIVSELRTERTKLVDRLRHVDVSCSFGSWQVGRRAQFHQTEAYPVSLGSQTDEPRAESAMGKESSE